jgi:hypothetical protein
LEVTPEEERALEDYLRHLLPMLKQLDPRGLLHAL